METPTRKARKSKKELGEEIEKTKKLLAMKEDELVHLLRSGTLASGEVALVESRLRLVRERDKKRLQQMTTRFHNGAADEKEA